MIANTLLNQIVIEKKIHQPSLILDELHLKIKETIQHGDSKSKDGMDLAICCIEPPTAKKGKIHISFAGAKCNLYYTANESLNKIEGDRKIIGEMASKNYAKFTNHQLYLDKGDRLYLTTDGLIDICNPQRKRFGKKSYEELLNEMKTLPFEKHQKMIEDCIDAFQQDAEQRDDISLMAVRL
jgi:serine phosphatase RsbU (regulator of sigma subunit)